MGLQSWESVLTSHTAVGTDTRGGVGRAPCRSLRCHSRSAGTAQGTAGTERRAQAAGGRIAVVELGVELTGDIHRGAASDHQVQARRRGGTREVMGVVGGAIP